jgi:hypothetical protein
MKTAELRSAWVGENYESDCSCQLPIRPRSSFVMTTHDERGRPPSSPSGHELNRLGSAGSFVCWFWYFVTMGSARRGADGASTAQDYLGT